MDRTGSRPRRRSAGRSPSARRTRPAGLAFLRPCSTRGGRAGTRRPADRGQASRWGVTRCCGPSRQSWYRRGRRSADNQVAPTGHFYAGVLGCLPVPYSDGSAAARRSSSEAVPATLVKAREAGAAAACPAPVGTLTASALSGAPALPRWLGLATTLVAGAATLVFGAGHRGVRVLVFLTLKDAQDLTRLPKMSESSSRNSSGRDHRRLGGRQPVIVGRAAAPPRLAAPSALAVFLVLVTTAALAGRLRHRPGPQRCCCRGCSSASFGLLVSRLRRSF